MIVSTGKQEKEGMKMRVLDLTGQRFGRLLVKCLSHIDKQRHSNWSCLCDCGESKVVTRGNLKKGNVKSCGCLFGEGNNRKHGHRTKAKTSKVYMTWGRMVKRCYNKNDSSYSRYGGRGISVCKRWLIFENFLENMGEPPTKNHSIDRINNDGNYCKSNCRWATSKQQQRNTRNNLMITHNGQTFCLAEWSERTGIKKHSISQRLKQGWSMGKIINEYSCRTMR